MNIFKRIKRIEQEVFKPEFSDDLIGCYNRFKYMLKGSKNMYEKVETLITRVEELEAQNKRLMDYLDLKYVNTKAKESKVVLKKK